MDWLKKLFGGGKKAEAEAKSTQKNGFSEAAQATRENRIAEARGILVVLAEEALATYRGMPGSAYLERHGLKLLGPSTCYSIALGLAGYSDRAKELLSTSLARELASAKESSNPEYGAEEATKIALAYTLIGDRSAARQAFEAMSKQVGYISNAGAKTHQMIDAAKAARAGNEDELCSTMLAEARKAAESMRRTSISFSSRSGEVVPGTPEHAQVAGSWANSLLKEVDDAGAEIREQPTGVEGTFAAYCRKLHLDDFLHAIDNDVPSAIHAAGSIDESYGRLVAIVTVLAKLYDRSGQ